MQINTTRPWNVRETFVRPSTIRRFSSDRYLKWILNTFPYYLTKTVNSLEIKPTAFTSIVPRAWGHSHAVAQRLSDKGRLIAIDRDPEAIEVLKARFAPFPNVEIVHNTFDNISAILNGRKADGIMADLGVSSHQIDTAERGFCVSYGRAA